jgi:hypothetical protein
MFAKPAGAAGEAVPDAERELRTSEAGPEALLVELRSLVTDHYPEAQKLAARAAALFPHHDGVRSAHRVLNSPTGPAGKAPAEPATDEEIDWLQHPPESVRGKWVALSGSELVATAEKLADLVKALRARNFNQRALLHHVE